MFDEYLLDASFLADQAKLAETDADARRYYRAAVFYLASATEAFLNYLADSLAQLRQLSNCEEAFLTDKKLGRHKGLFIVEDSPEYHRLEDKLKFLLYRFCPGFDCSKEPAWGRLTTFVKFRNAIVHPRHEEDPVSVASYRQTLAESFTATVCVMNNLCQGIFGRPLRPGLRDLGDA